MTIDLVDEVTLPRSIARVLDLFEVVLGGGSLQPDDGGQRVGADARPRRCATCARSRPVAMSIATASGDYSAGPTILRIAASLRSGTVLDRLAATAQPHLDRLAERTGESTYLAVSDGRTGHLRRHRREQPGDPSRRAGSDRTSTSPGTALGAALAEPGVDRHSHRRRRSRRHRHEPRPADARQARRRHLDRRPVAPLHPTATSCIGARHQCTRFRVRAGVDGGGRAARTGTAHQRRGPHHRDHPPRRTRRHHRRRHRRRPARRTGRAHRRRRSNEWPRPAPSSIVSPRASRSTASRPGSARSPPCRSHPSGDGRCRPPSSDRTPPEWVTPVEDEVVRAMVLLRARTLALGYSGARPLVAQAMVDLLNAGITPIVPEYGSLGASGDLAPLAHGALALLGEGDVVYEASSPTGRRSAARRPDSNRSSSPRRRGWPSPTAPTPSSGMLCLAIADTQRLLEQADMTAAMTIEGLLATDAPFAADLQALRPQPGQAVSAANLRTMLAGSPIVASHAHPDDRTGAGRLLDPLYAVGARCGARHAGALPLRRRERTRRGDRQPDGAPGRSRRIVRQLPRCTARVRRRLPGDRRGRDRSDRRTPDRPHARHDAQPRPPTVPRSTRSVSTAA